MVDCVASGDDKVPSTRAGVYARLGMPLPPPPPTSSSAAAPLEFQALSWHAMDEEDANVGGEDDDEDDGDEGGKGKADVDSRRYVVRAFGVDAAGRSACLRIDDFTPFLYLRVPPAMSRGARRSTNLREIERHLTSSSRFLRCKAVTPVRKKDFWGFTDGELFEFFRLTFWSLAAMRQAASRLRKPQVIRALGGNAVDLRVYESNLDPLLRLLHVRDLRPVGWLRVAAADLSGADPSASTCQVSAACSWRCVHPAADLEAAAKTAPLLVAGFDIECNSAHGDFPVARKDYRRLAIDLEGAWTGNGGNLSLEAARLVSATTSAAPKADKATSAQTPAQKGTGGGGLRTHDVYVAKKVLLEVVRRALGLTTHEEDAGPMPSSSIKVAKLELKSPPAAGSRSSRDLHELLTRSSFIDDVYSELKNPPKAPPKVAVVAAKTFQTGNDEDDEPEDLSTVGRLTKLLNGVLVDRWPLHGDAAIQIGVTLGLHPKVAGGGDALVNHILVLGTCEPIAGACVKAFDREADMLLAFVELVRDVDPDVVLGYNIFGFDFAYLYDRAVELGIQKDFLRCGLGRVRGLPSAYVEQKLSSSALGDNVLKYVEMHGRVVVDLMKVVQRDHRLDSYKLDTVAEHFLGMRKNDVSPNDVFRLQRGSAADRRVIAEYCIQDCALCNRLADKLQILTNNSGMANVCLVPLSFIFMRGQGVKIFSLVAKRCRDDGFLVPARQKAFAPGGGGGGGGGGDEEDQEGYEGAIVLEPETGMYLDDPVSVLDYNSLYPSSMISHNLSHDSLVMDAAYDNLPGVEYSEVVYDRYEGEGDEKRVVGQQVCRFAKGTSGAHGPSGTSGTSGTSGAVLPRILKDLLAQRKATRKRIPDEPDPFVRAVLDGLQNAYKVTANSLYGQMGAKTSPLYLKHVAACTTAVGRSMIMQAKAYVEGPECGGHVVYGDSVAGYTPVHVRLGGTEVVLDTVEGVARRMLVLVSKSEVWMPCAGDGREGKESLELPGVEVWSDGGWTDAVRLVRHRLAAHKGMVRVVTSTGFVDVTEDHSLLRHDGSVVKPRDVAVGDRLLHHPLPAFEAPEAADAISADEARIMGLFMGAGSCEGDRWAIFGSTPKLMRTYEALCRRVYPDVGWMCFEVAKAKAKATATAKATADGGSEGAEAAYALFAVCRPDATSDLAEDVERLERFVGRYRGMMYAEDGSKVVPKAVLGAPADVREAFCLGMHEEDQEDRRAAPRQKHSQKHSQQQQSQLSSATVFALGASLGCSPTTASQRLDDADVDLRVRSVVPLPAFATEVGAEPPHVYDFTTASGHFAAGVGRLVVHNTDSIFVVFKNADAVSGAKLRGRDALASSIRQGQAASRGIKPQLAAPHNLEYEKTMFPLILLSKKRYVGLLYEDDPDAVPKQKSMGIALKRRDYAPIVKQVNKLLYFLESPPLPCPLGRAEQGHLQEIKSLIKKCTPARGKPLGGCVPVVLGLRGVAWGCLGLPGVAWGCLGREMPGVARGRQGLPGVARGRQGMPGVLLRGVVGGLAPLP